MSYDLDVWRASRPITCDEASAIARRLCEGGLDATAEASPQIELFYRELVETHPELHTLPDSEIERSPWSCQIQKSDRYVGLCMGYSFANKVVPFVEQLAAKHGLVCYNGQSGIVKWPPHLEAMPHLRLAMENGRVIDQPGAPTISSAIASLKQPENGFMILSRSDERYMQVVICKDGRWVIEQRDGSADRHFEIDPVQPDAAEQAFIDYASGNDHGWQALPWIKLEL